MLMHNKFLVASILRSIVFCPLMFQCIHEPVSTISEFRSDGVQESESMISLQRVGKVMSAFAYVSNKLDDMGTEVSCSYM